MTGGEAGIWYGDDVDGAKTQGSVCVKNKARVCGAALVKDLVLIGPDESPASFIFRRQVLPSSDFSRKQPFTDLGMKGLDGNGGLRLDSAADLARLGGHGWRSLT